ncbi:MAG: hypothetical protein M3161_05395 [Actinomycetota bacterium]|nr:hypothetical protein [Actinomycetota bacterium]
MRDDLKRMAMLGSGVAELTRNRAEQLAKDLIARSNKNRSELVRLIRSEIANQLQSFGVATKRDVERLERRVARLESGDKKTTRTRSSTAAKKETSARSGAAKSTDG